MDNLIGLFWSILIIVILLISAGILHKFKLISDEGSRKLIHIGIGHWWIIAMLFFSSVYFAIIPPLIYIILNSTSYYFDLVKPMERNDNDLGTIYYPFSLLILAIFTFELINQPYIGLIGTLIMAYGDGLAAIIGKNIKSMKIYKNKTLAGSLTMLVVSFIITLAVSIIFKSPNMILNLLILPPLATILELYFPYGTDNLSVPILTSIVYYLITLI